MVGLEDSHKYYNESYFLQIFLKNNYNKEKSLKDISKHDDDYKRENGIK